MIAFHERSTNLRLTPEDADRKTDSLLEKYKEIKLYKDGAPEEFAQKEVEKLFKESSKENWDYVNVYKQFKLMYPRVTSGNPREAWVSDSLIEGRTQHRLSVCVC